MRPWALEAEGGEIGRYRRIVVPDISAELWACSASSAEISAVCAGVATIAIYLVFDRIFALPWPQSLIGDLWPGLRDVTGLV